MGTGALAGIGAAGVGAAADAFGGIMDMVGSAVQQYQQNRDTRNMSVAMIPQIENAIEEITNMVKENQASEDEAIGYLTEVFDSAGGTLRTTLMDGLKTGIQTINDNARRSIEAIQFNIKEAREEASFQEQRELDRAEEELEGVKQSFEKSNRELGRGLAARGLAGAMTAAFKQSRDGLVQAQTKLREQSDNVLERISRGLAGAVRTGQFQIGQVGGQAGTQTRQLTQDISGQLAQGLSGLAMNKAQVIQGEKNRFADIDRDLRGEKIAAEGLLASTEEGQFAGLKGKARSDLENLLATGGRIEQLDAPPRDISTNDLFYVARTGDT